MIESVRYGSKSEYEGVRLRGSSQARIWFHERGFDRCEACGWLPPWHPRMTGPDLLGMLAFHHILPKKAGGLDLQGNLALLCCNCHRLAHFLWPLRRANNGRKYYRGPKGRTEFVEVMRDFVSDPEAWYRKERAARRFAGTNFTGSVLVIDDSQNFYPENRSYEPKHG